MLEVEALAEPLLALVEPPLLVAHADMASADPASRARAFTLVLLVVNLRSFLAVSRGTRSDRPTIRRTTS